MTAAADTIVDHAAGGIDDDDADPVVAEAASGRQDGWTPARQRNFLTFLAEGHTVELACRCVGMTVSSAYALRRRAGGAAFALGWQAAGLLARDTIADTLGTRAIDGQVETITRDDGSTVTRHRFDNRLAMSMLLRLDRQADAAVGAASYHAARMVASDWEEAYLAGLERDPGPARAGLFLGLRADAATDAVADGPDVGPIVALARADRFVRTGVAVLAELDAGDLDPSRRADWSAADWARAEAAGLVALAPPPMRAAAAAAGDAAGVAAGGDRGGAQGADRDGAITRGAPPLPPLRPGPPMRSDGDGPVWWHEDDEEWRTFFPPPPGFVGTEEGSPDDDEYERSLTAAEQDTLETARTALGTDTADPAAAAERDAWFAALAARTLAGGVDPGASDRGEEDAPRSSVESGWASGEEEAVAAPAAVGTASADGAASWDDGRSPETPGARSQDDRHAVVGPIFDVTPTTPRPPPGNGAWDA